MLLFALAVQAVIPAVPLPAMPARISILVPVPDQRCTRAPRAGAQDDDIVVCGDPLPAQALPLPAEAVSPRPVSSNPDMTGIGALRAQATPCAARNGGCTTGVNMLGGGTALIRGLQKLVAPGSCCEAAGEATDPLMLVRDMAGGVGRLFRGKPDHSGRVAIPLDDKPLTTSRVLP